MATSSELKIYRGDTKTFSLTFQNSEGNAKDITGATIYFTAKKDVQDSDDDAVIQVTQTTHSDPTNGKSSIALSTDDTDIDPGRYNYDFQLVESDGSVTTLVVDRLVILADISRTIS